MKNYKEIKEVGKGGFGNVKLYRNIKNEKLYAIKGIFLKDKSQEAISKIKNESIIQMRIYSPYVVQCYDFFEENSTFNIVMEYCNGGTLSNLIKSAKKNFPEEFIWELFLKITLGVGAFHTRKIIHRDLKPLNIFLLNNNEPKIGDLGIARQLNQEDYASTFAGTWLYLSPEVVSHKPYNEKSDIWALGCILYEMCTLKFPFLSGSIADLVKKILERDPSPIPSMYSSNLSNLIKEMLSKDSRKRPSIYEILRKPFVHEKLKTFNLMNYAIQLYPNLSDVVSEPCDYVGLVNPNFATVFALMEEIYRRSLKKKDACDFKNIFNYNIKSSDKECLSQLSVQHACLKITLIKYAYDNKCIDFPFDLKKEEVLEFLNKWKTVSSLTPFCQDLIEFFSCRVDGLNKVISQKKKEITKKVEEVVNYKIEPPKGKALRKVPINPSNNFLSNLKLDQDIKIHSGLVSSLCLLENDRFASCSEDKTIKVYNMKTFKCDLTISSHTERINYLSLIKRYLCSASRDQTIGIWEIKGDNYKCVQILRGHSGNVWKVTEISNNRIASCSSDRTLIIWNAVAPFEKITTLKDKHTTNIISFIETKDKKYIISGGSIGDNKIVFWESSSYKYVREIQDVFCSWNNSMLEVAKKKLLVGGKEKVFMIDIASFKVEKTFESTSDDIGYVNCILELPDKTLLCGCGNSKQGKLINLDLDTNKIIYKIENAHEHIILDLLLIDDKNLISSSADGLIKIWK